VTWVIQLLDGSLCSESNDLRVKIWGKDTEVCELTIYAYSFCRIVQLRDGRICSADRYGNIKIWNIITGVCELTLQSNQRQALYIIQAST
jgi:hypothetical protein